MPHKLPRGQTERLSTNSSAALSVQQPSSPAVAAYYTNGHLQQSNHQPNSIRSPAAPPHQNKDLSTSPLKGDLKSKSVQRQNGTAGTSAKPTRQAEWLPIAHPAEGSTLAALFGFDEKTASFVTTAGNNGWEPAQTQETVWDLLPSLEDVGQTQSNGNTGDSIKRLWEATEQMDLAPRQTEYAKEVGFYRRPRRTAWLWLLGATALFTAVFMVGKSIVDRSSQALSERQGQHAQAALSLSAALVPIDDLLNGDSYRDTLQMNLLTNQLGALDGTAREALTLANQPLPSKPLIGSGLSIENLASEQESLEVVSAQALILEQRLNNMISYTQTYSQAFQMPPLPEQASIEEIDITTTNLSQAIAETRSVLNDLPDIPDFSAHREDAQQILVFVESMQDEYLQALRTDDLLKASQAKNEILNSIAALDRQLSAPQDTVALWSKQQISTLRSQLEQINL